MVEAEELAPAELGVGSRQRLKTWPFTLVRFGLSTGTRVSLRSQPRNSDDVMGWLRLAGEKQAETDQVCSHMPDLVTVRNWSRRSVGRIQGHAAGPGLVPI